MCCRSTVTWRVTSTMNLNVMIGTWWCYITLDLIILDTLMVHAVCLFSQSLVKWIQLFSTSSIHSINRYFWLTCAPIYLYLDSLLFWLKCLFHSIDKHLYQLCQPWLTTVIVIGWFIIFSWTIDFPVQCRAVATNSNAIETTGCCSS